MRIFVKPRNGDSFDRVVIRALEILHDANIQSAHAGHTANGHAIVLIDPEDVPGALATLEQAGLRSSVGASGQDKPPPTEGHRSVRIAFDVRTSR
jgi:hypothetical protein